ncbi:MAG: choice-of-anchor D domain-containing protein [Solirubrobacteraceae bacterium]|nr:choice-of-anchor D domain-containing protein [Solirubrobacteraceae bacterium]
MSLARRSSAFAVALFSMLVVLLGSASGASAAFIINSVSPNPVAAGSTINASLTSTTASGQTVVYLYLTGPNTNDLLLAATTVSTPGTATLTATIPPDRTAGNYSVRVIFQSQTTGSTGMSNSVPFSVVRYEPVFTSATGPSGVYDVSDPPSAQYAAIPAAGASGTVAVACTLDGASLPCSATTAAIPSGAAFGNHTLTVTASNSGFSTSKTYGFTVAPLVTVSSGPSAGDAVSGVPSWTFAASVPASFACRVYPAAAAVVPEFGSCSSTMSNAAPGLQPGNYLFQVRATAGGYTGPPTARSFSVAADVAAAAPTVTPSGTIDFGSVAQTTLSQARSITISNTAGSAALRIGRAVLVGTDGEDFIVSGDTCSGEAIAVGGSCTIRVRFAPSNAGSAAASLSLAANTALPITMIPLVGTGGDLPTGPQGIAGPAGPTGAAGVNGAAGADGAAGTPGTNGAAGANGTAGPTGATGPAGAPGRNAVVTCVAKRPVKGRVPVRCTVKLASTPKKGTAARLTQRGKRVAARQVTSRTSTLRFTLPRGRYVLSIAGATVAFRA